MANKTSKSYRVYFYRTAVGENADPLHQRLHDAFTEHGQHLPVIDLGGEKFQMRDLQKVGTVWKGSFAKLRDEAPHVVAANHQERELPLDDGDHLIEKCYFLLHEQKNLIVWQINKTAGGPSRAEEYLSQLFRTFVILPQVINSSRLEQIMSGQVYELDFAYDRPVQINTATPQWSRNAFDIMSSIDAAHAKFNLRAPKSGSLGDSVKKIVSQMVTGTFGAKKIKVRLTEETNLVDVIMAPLKEIFEVQVLGRYPKSSEVFEQLELAYDRQRDRIPELTTPH